jgi:hypothetical protein
LFVALLSNVRRLTHMASGPETRRGYQRPALLTEARNSPCMAGNLSNNWRWHKVYTQCPRRWLGTTRKQCPCLCLNTYSGRHEWRCSDTIIDLGQTGEWSAFHRKKMPRYQLYNSDLQYVVRVPLGVSEDILRDMKN